LIKKSVWSAAGVLLAVVMALGVMTHATPAQAASTYYIDAFALTAAGTSCNEAGVQGGANPASNIEADGSVAYNLCVHVNTASTANAVLDPAGFNASLGGDVNGGIVAISVSLGVVSTGTSKSTNVITDASGFAKTNYRGGGNQETNDTAVASMTVNSAIATMTIGLVTTSGGDASKMVFMAPSEAAIAAHVDITSPGYVSPLLGTNISLQVQDASGVGVDGEVVLVSIDKGGMIEGFNGDCTGTISKSITPTTANQELSPGASTTKAGVVQITICADQKDAPGKATLTAQNYSTSMANVTASVMTAGRPAKIAVSSDGSTVTATVTDSAGNPVADYTPVKFTAAGQNSAVADTCVGTANGTASTTVSGSALVSVSWNETGNTVVCNGTAPNSDVDDINGSPAYSASGSKSLSATSAGGSTTTPTTPAAGTISSGSIPAAGGFGLVVYGGPVSSLVAASGCPAGTAAFWATVNGNFVTYVPGTSIAAVNADFMAAFSAGVPAGTPLIGKCK
jgi:hypothetical protein